MALGENEGMNTTMLVSPANGGYPMAYGNSAGLGFGNDWGSLIILFLIFGMFGNGFGGFGGGGFGNSYDFPWLMNGQNGINANIANGFQNAQLSDSITSVRDGISGLSTQMCGATGDIQMSLCNGFNGVVNSVNGVNTSISNAQNALAQQMYANQLSDLERSFAAQTASTQGMTAIQSQLAQCCCDNRLASADLKYTIATENCADRTALADGLRDVLESQSAGVQRILDQMCNDKIDAKNERIADLERQLTMANLAASQSAQTAAILANNDAQTNALEQYLAPVPRPAYIVQNPNGCGCNSLNTGCGCAF